MMRGALLLVLGASFLGGCTDWKPSQATVTSIDRTCMIVERSRLGSREDSSGKSREMSTQRTYEGRCDEVDGWAEEKAKRSMKIDGKAKIYLSYTAADGKSVTGSIAVTGRDPQFYDLSVGDTVPVRVDAENPERVVFG